MSNGPKKKGSFGAKPEFPPSYARSTTNLRVAWRHSSTLFVSVHAPYQFSTDHVGHMNRPPIPPPRLLLNLLHHFMPLLLIILGVWLVNGYGWPSALPTADSNGAARRIRCYCASSHFPLALYPCLSCLLVFLFWKLQGSAKPWPFLFCPASFTLRLHFIPFPFLLCHFLF